MELIGYFFGSKYTVEVPDTATFEDFGMALLKKVGLPRDQPRPDFTLRFPVGMISTYLTLDLQILKMPVFQGEKRPPIYLDVVETKDLESLGKLQAFLRICASEVGPREVTFVAVGSYDNGHGRESTLRQQCPPRLLACCLERRIDLNIILIDPGFAKPDSDAGQACSLGGWVKTHEEEGGKIRQYMNQTALAGRRCDMWMTIFGIPVDEYLTFDKSKVVGGVNLEATFSAVLQHEDCALICGNFYSEAIPQYFTRGDARLLAAAGIEPRT